MAVALGSAVGGTAVGGAGTVFVGGMMPVVGDGVGEGVGVGVLAGGWGGAGGGEGCRPPVRWGRG
ncbi:MAG TPA: hypothetical protein PJ988_06110, partial [Anaerolinea sp.]|nr:hypothetical protein [Anaerolinea sp.]